MTATPDEPQRRMKSGCVSRALLTNLALDISEKWKPLGRVLLANEQAIKRIVADNKRDAYEQCYQMLSRWIEMKGYEATYQALAEALGREFVNLQIYIEKYCLEGQDQLQPVHQIEGISNVLTWVIIGQYTVLQC